MNVDRISAVTFRVRNMRASVEFYRDVLGMKVVYGGENAAFTSLCMRKADSPVLNLEHGPTITGWGRLIFHVAEVDSLWKHLRNLGFEPEQPQDASWGERYFHMHDPDGHE